MVGGRESTSEAIEPAPSGASQPVGCAPAHAGGDPSHADRPGRPARLTPVDPDRRAASRTADRPRLATLGRLTRLAGLACLAAAAATAAYAETGGGEYVDPTAQDLTVEALLDDPWLKGQREAWRRAIVRARQGDAAALGAVDTSYPLHPDLTAAWLAADVGARHRAELVAFLERHHDLRPARALRHAWLRTLATEGRWGDFLAAWDAHDARPGAALTCLHLRARLEAGPDDDLVADALAVWRVGHSQPDECDPVFRHLDGAGALTLAEYRRRIDLALGEREYGLAAYLARRATQAERERVERFRTAAARPAEALDRSDVAALAVSDPQWLYLAFDRLAVNHAAEAAARWAALEDTPGIDRTLAWRISRRIALSFARDLAPQAAQALDDLAWHDEDTAAWRARTAMRQQDWPALSWAVSKLPEEEQRRAEWRYWEGRALAGMDRFEEAREVLALAAADRSFHGFMAADMIGAPYAFAHNEGAPDAVARRRLLREPAVRRALELWLAGESGDARVEWYHATAALNLADKREAALLAKQLGWHPSAIATAAQARLWDDLDLRFPLPWRDTFESFASQAGLPVPFALGIARSESLFYERAVSPAGAIGLMQIMPATGRGVAERTALADWRGRSTLLEPETNIALGTRYLSELLARLGQHPALAAAAYNAGEHRVNAWLPRAAPIPADAWIDSVPFTETRQYVQRVLMARTIYDWRLAGQPSAPADRLIEQLPPVPTLAQLEQGAREGSGGGS